eukprot:IDg22086t1
MLHNDIPTVPLQDFLNGTMYRSCMLVFENAMNHFVKSTMKEKFPITDPNDEYLVSQQELASILELLEEKMRAVKADLEAALELKEKAYADSVKKPGVESRISLGQAKSTVKKLSRELEALDKQHKRMQKVPRPQERWVRECRKAFASDKMRELVTADARLDLYNIAAIMLYHLRRVFAPRLQSEVVVEHKALLQKLLFASEMCTQRAHVAPPSEAEVVDALGVMKAILLQCKLDTAAEEISDPMSKAQLLFGKATQASSNGSSQAAFCKTNQLLSNTEWQALVLYRALNEFETQLEHELRPEIEKVYSGTENTHGEQKCEDSAEINKGTRAVSKPRAFFTKMGPSFLAQQQLHGALLGENACDKRIRV